jgi:hypothetical protein
LILSNFVVLEEWIVALQRACQVTLLQFEHLQCG